MVRRVNLNDPIEQRMAKRFAALEAQAPVGSTSITKPGSRLRVESDGGILAKEVAGGAPAISVEGRQNVSGQLDGDGTFDWDGPAFFRDTLDVEAAVVLRALTRVLGDLTVEKTLDVTATTTLGGVVELLSDLILRSGGSITVGKMRIDPTVGQGAVVFDNGAQVFSDADTIQVYKGSSVAQIADGYARLQSGGVALTVENGKGIRMTGVPKKTGTGLPPGAIGRDSTGYLYEAQ